VEPSVVADVLPTGEQFAPMTAAAGADDVTAGVVGVGDGEVVGVSDGEVVVESEAEV
jgi:hypothetical protein